MSNDGRVIKAEGNFETRNQIYDRLVLPLTRQMAHWSQSDLREKILSWFGQNGESTSLLFDRPDSGGRLLKENSATWYALHYLYNFREIGTKDWLDYFWTKNLLNAKAVRNRLKIVKSQLRKNILRQAENHQTIRILSLASGSAQGLIQVLSELKDNKDFAVNAVLVDHDPEALEMAAELARQQNVRDLIRCREESVFRTVYKLPDRPSPHLVQMIGLLDYLEDSKAVKMMQKIQSGLKKGGAFMTCNIFDNLERPFVRDVSEWEMIYRKPEDLIRMADQAGFSYTEVVVEPIEIHGVAISHKAKSR